MIVKHSNEPEWDKCLSRNCMGADCRVPKLVCTLHTIVTYGISLGRQPAILCNSKHISTVEQWVSCFVGACAKNDIFKPIDVWTRRALL